jgi:hypothetical protein
MIQTVWVVSHSTGGEFVVEAVFATEEAARKYADKKTNMNGGYYDIQSYRVRGIEEQK